MRIGDKVRLLHGQEQGHIVAFGQKDVVEVEIEDGFVIPVLKKELVVVAKQEDDNFGNYEPTSAPARAAARKASGELYLACEPKGGNEFYLHFINDSDAQVLFSIGMVNKELYEGFYAGTCAKSSTEMLGVRHMRWMEENNRLMVQCISHSESATKYTAPMALEVKLNTVKILKDSTPLPLLDKQGHVIKLSQPGGDIDPADMRQSMLTPRPQQVAKDVRMQGKNVVVDLHIEQLTDDTDHMSTEQILQHQLAAFENALNSAMLQGADSLKIIHGVGNGTLRHQIHKALAHTPGIRFFEDVQKEKFGYGATLVHF